MMKKFSTIALFLLLLSVTVFAAVSCGEPESGSGEMTLEVKDMPQLMYVVGEELDLSNGILTVKENGESREVPMNDAAVAVSGFDKTKTGEQKVTLTYSGKSVEITVTVVERMQVIEHISEYLVGDELNTGKGRLKITRNDGSSYTVILNHEKVTLEGFDSTKAGTCNVKVSYEAEDETYTCTFAVQVYAVESVKLQRPNKIAYDSHEDGLDLAGGYLTLSGNGGALTKDVPLTDKTVSISGFDLSAVNAENTPYTQTVTVTYDQKPYTFDVRLTYTNISRFKEKAADFTELDWTGVDYPTVPEDLGAIAMELMEIYLDMSKAETQYITEEETMNVARAAFVHGMTMIEDDILALDDAFTIEYGSLVLNCRTPEAVAAAMEALEDKDNDLYTVSPLLNQIAKAFEEQDLLPEEPFGLYEFAEPEFYEELVAIFEYMLDLHEKFEALPANWKELDLTTIADDIESVYDFIVTSDYAAGSWGEIYYHVSSWRAQDDAFEILYNYYYAAEDNEALANLASVRLPLSLELMASYISLALEQINALSSFGEMDTSNFFYNYYMAMRTAEDIRLNGDEMTRTLYEILPVNTLMGLDPEVSFYFDDMLDYLRTVEGGYYHYSGALLDLPCYQDLMDHYMGILINIMEQEDYRDSEAYKADLEEMLAKFVAMTPTRQINFLSTINAYYTMGMPALAFEAVIEGMEGMEPIDVSCLFVSLLEEYYTGLFTDPEAAVAYTDLMVAIEIYGQRFSLGDTWLEAFLARLKNVADAYKEMNLIDKATFEDHLKDIYDQYVALGERYSNEEPVELGDWQATFDKLFEALQAMETAYMIVSDANGLPVYNMFFSACERVFALEAYILENAPEDICKAYYYDPLYVLEVEDEGGEMTEDGTATTVSYSFTYEYMVNSYRGLYVNELLTFLDVGIYDSYVVSDLKVFMELAYDVIWGYMFGDDDPATTDYNYETVLQAMTMFGKLSLDEQTMFIIMEGIEQSFYYYGLEGFLAEAFTENAGNVALKVLELEQACLMYEAMGTADYLAQLETSLNALKTLYITLGEEGEDKDSFADLEQFYADYVAKAEKLIADANPEVPEGGDGADGDGTDNEVAA